LPVDLERIDDAVLALLLVTSFSEGPVQRAWKGHDWAALDRLHLAGFISDPKNKNKSVALTSEGARRARDLYDQLVASESALGLPRVSARRGGEGTLPEEERLRIGYLLDHFCARLSRKASGRIDFFYTLRGSSAVLVQVGPIDGPYESIELPIARLRFDAKTAGWGLDWRRANERWEPYVAFERRRSVADLLREIAEDPDGVFFG